MKTKETAMRTNAGGRSRQDQDDESRLRDPIVHSAPEIGHIVQHHRKKRKLTLEQVAERSNVSRSMLSQIERGEANPTFAVLWRLTRALGMSIGDLAILASDVRDGRTELVSSTQIPEFRSPNDSWRMRILSPPRTAGETEWYDIEIAGGGIIDSSPHYMGAWEHLTPLTGALTVTSGAEHFHVENGDTARYPADVHHSIQNPSSQPVRALLVTLYNR
jgi:transcriptional regulator with XRE-family HTH domain